MIQKLSDPGSGFRGALNYALAAKKEPELIGGNMAGESARELAKEFGEGRALNPAVEKPVFHGSLTAPESDRLSEEQWRRFAECYLERLGYGRSQWALIRHHDTAITSTSSPTASTRTAGGCRTSRRSSAARRSCATSSGSSA